MIKDLLNNRISGVSLSLLALMALLLVPVAIDDVRYIFLSLFVTGYLTWHLISDETSRVPVLKFVVPMALFCLLAILSFFWTDDISQALRHSFIWSIFILYALVIFTHHKKEADFGRQLAKLFSYLFGLLILLHLGALNFEISLDRDWNELMSKGKNYTTTLLTVLSPYLLFYPSKSQFIRFSKIISIILLANILFLTGARGALLAFIIIVFIKLWNFYAHTAWRFFGAIAGFAVIIAGIYLLNTSTATTDFTFVNEYRQELESRVRMNKNSLKSIQEKPLVGVGAGHWAREIYKYGIGDVAPLNDKNEIIRYRSHNGYFKIAVEYGLLGFCLFFLPIIMTLFRYRNRWTELTGIQKGAWTSLAAWLIVIFFYATAVPYSYFFSGITLVGFTSLGLLFPSKTEDAKGKKFVGIIAIVLAVLCALWFSFTKVCHSSYQKAERLEQQGKYKEAFEIYEELYNNVFFASADYQRSVDLRLAELSVELGQVENAALYYERGLTVMPHSSVLLSSYIDYLGQFDSDSDRLPQIKERLRRIQPNLVSK